MAAPKRVEDDERAAPEGSGARKLKSYGRCGRYDLVVPLDAGGMGEVYLARRRGDGALAAVKRLLPQMASDETFTAMFLDDARLAARLVHPNVCGVLEIGEAGGTLYIAMELIHGVSLKQLFRHPQLGGKLPIPIVARIVADVAAALDYAHSLTDAGNFPLGIVHRDVSPPNVMLGYDGRVKLLDFGLAKARTQAHKTHSGFVKGKFGYLAPEQIGEMPLDGRTDLFALGLCLFEGLTGRQLFDQPNPAMTIAAIRDFVRAPSVRRMRPDVTDALDEVVQRSLARDPADRYPSAAAMRAGLLGAVPNVATAEELASFIDGLFPERERAAELGLTALSKPSQPAPAPTDETALVAEPLARAKHLTRLMLIATAIVIACTIGLLLAR